MLNNHIIPGCPYVKELEWSVRHLVCSDHPREHALLPCDSAYLSRRGFDSLRICYDGILWP